jgi:hypothetical protein
MKNCEATKIFCEIMGGKMSTEHAECNCAFKPTDGWGRQGKDEKTGIGDSQDVDLLVDSDMFWIWAGNHFDVHGVGVKKDSASVYQYFSDGKPMSRVAIAFDSSDGPHELNCAIPMHSTSMECRYHPAGAGGGDDQRGEKKQLTSASQVVKKK